MNKLVKNKLAKGMLFKVEKQFLIDRYNEALFNIVGKKTELKEFYIDALGFSTEIEEELKIPNYLNKGNINQKFIIITIEQKDLPILNTSFTNKKYLWKNFLEDNFDVIINLSALSSIYGEIDNDIIKVNEILDIVQLDKVEFILETPKKLIRKNREFLSLIKTFKEGDNCLNEDLTNRLIEISEEVGDVFNKPIIPVKTEYNISSFFTTHFDGFYLFRDASDFKNIIIIPMQYSGKSYSDLLPGFDVDTVVFNEENVLSFLTEYGLVDILDENFYKENIEIIKNKMEYLVINIMSKDKNSKTLIGLSENEYKNYIFDNYNSLPKSYKDLEIIYKKLQKNVPIEIDNLHLRTKFMLMRPNKNLGQNERELIYHLISNFDKTDFVRNYAFNKPLFFDRYEKFNDNFKDYVVEKLLEDYVPYRKENIKERI